MFTFGYKMSAAQLLPSACEPHAKFRAYPGVSPEFPKPSPTQRLWLQR